MNSKEFKNTVFDIVAKSNGFENAFGGWFKESSECIAVLELQKSNYGDYYELNIKIYIQGVFGNKYKKCKELVKQDTGDIFIRAPKTFKDVFDFDKTVDDSLRKDQLSLLFQEFIVPYTDKALSLTGIKQLSMHGDIFLLPAIKEELGM